MNALAPYTLRVHDPALNGPIEQRYVPLDDVRKKDTYSILKSFMEGYSDDFSIREKDKQVFRFVDVSAQAEERVLDGWLEVGEYGTKNDIINIGTGDIDFEKTQDNAEILKYYVRFHFPIGCNEAIALMHVHRGNGVKTLFFNVFKEYFNDRTKLHMQMNPLSYDKAFAKWQDAVAKELRLVKFSAAPDIVDSLGNLGHQEPEVRIKPPRGGTFGRLKEFFGKNSDQSHAIEHLSSLCTQIKTVVELDGKKRTFNVGGSANNRVCEVEAPDDLNLVDGNPTLQAMREWASEIDAEFCVKIYPHELNQ